LHALHSVLAAQLAELRPTLGDKIAVMYVGVGKVDTPGGTSTYHNYKAVKDVAPQLIDWSKYGPRRIAEALPVRAPGASWRGLPAACPRSTVAVRKVLRETGGDESCRCSRRAGALSGVP
jgi:hypothetical protein